MPEKLPEQQNGQGRSPGREAAAPQERVVHRRAAPQGGQQAAPAQRSAQGTQSIPAAAGAQAPARPVQAGQAPQAAARATAQAAPAGRPAGEAARTAPMPAAAPGRPVRHTAQPAQPGAPGVRPAGGWNAVPANAQGTAAQGGGRPANGAPPRQGVAARADVRAMQAAAARQSMQAPAGTQPVGGQVPLQGTPPSVAVPAGGQPAASGCPAAQGTATGQQPAPSMAAAATPAGGQGASVPAPASATGTGPVPKAALPGGGLWAEKEAFNIPGFIGNVLYNLGFAGEYHALRLWRAVRVVAALVGQLLFWALRGIGRALLKLARGIGRDLAAPFVQFRRKLRQAKRLRERLADRQARHGAAAAAGKSKTLAGARAKVAARLALALLRPALPVLAAVVLVVTVYNVVNVEYALAVEVDGTVLGYVRDQAVVENAKGLLRDRIKLAGDQQVTDWQLQPTYTLGQATDYTTTHQLVNEILLNNFGEESDLVSANGLYIDNTLYAVTTEGEQLAEYLAQRLETYRDPAAPEAEVSFVRKVECDLNPEDVFFASSIVPYDTLIDKLEANVSGERRYVAAEGDTLDTIAHQHDITLEALKARNPAIAAEEGDFEPEAGTDMLISRAQPFLQVQQTIRRSSVEAIPYATVEEASDSRPKGYSRRIQTGAEGQMEVWDDYYYIDGELVRTERVDDLTVVLVEPVDEIIEVGSLEISALTPAVGGYGGYYMFPVPDSPYSSRGFGAHRGMDINAAYGAPIYACEGGTVVESGWHWSWGNYIRIEHPGGISTLYAHCSALYVAAGQQVGQGQHIGAVGATGVATGNHCHLEIWVNGGLVDPVGFVGYPYG